MGGRSQWYRRHANDPFVKRARREGKRSRAAFKLTEILDRHGIAVGRDAVVVDLGCAPGSWSAEIVRRLGPAGRLVGIDLLPLEPIAGATLIRGDFTEPEGMRAVAEALDGRGVDLVLSDMAPEMSGNKVADQARTIGLNEAVLHFAECHLQPGGHLLLKSFMGEGFQEFRAAMATRFRSVKNVKPAASRKRSSELYLLGLDFRAND